MHYGKFKLIQMGGQGTDIKISTGEAVVAAASMDYLGTLLSESSYKLNSSAELSRRLGMVKGDFQSLEKVWNHSALSRERKLQIFRSLLESKLSYSLPCAVFCKGDLRRLDDFHCRCLRKTWNVPSVFYSRISNVKVLRRAQHPCASSQLLHRQFVFLGPRGTLAGRQSTEDCEFHSWNDGISR